MQVIAHQGDTLDNLCWRHLGTTSIVEQTMAQNPGLAALGAILPEGTPVALPEIENSQTAKSPNIQLWD